MPLLSGGVRGFKVCGLNWWGGGIVAAPRSIFAIAEILFLGEGTGEGDFGAPELNPGILNPGWLVGWLGLL